MRASQADDSATGQNPFGAMRMAVIAFVGFNLAYGCFFGTLPVLMLAMEDKLGVSREQVALAFTATAIAGALLGPVVGNLANRVPLQWLFMAGGLAMALGNLLAANAQGTIAFVAIHALLIGPAMVTCGGVLPAIIVTRWFDVNRGKALGLAHTPIILALFPVIIAQVLERGGVEAAYYFSAVAACGILIAGLFLRDPPNRSTTQQQRGVPLFKAAPPVLKRPAFWAIMLPTVCLMAAMGMLGAHVVAMADGWGIAASDAAVFLSANSLAAIIGPIVFGWLSDRRGGSFSITLIALACGGLWALMLLEPGFAFMLAIVAGVGAVNGGLIPSASSALAQALGREQFPTAYGLSKLLPLPLTASAAPLAALVYSQTGSYQAVIAVTAAVLVVLAPVALLGRARPSP